MTLVRIEIAILNLANNSIVFKNVLPLLLYYVVPFSSMVLH